MGPGIRAFLAGALLVTLAARAQAPDGAEPPPAPTAALSDVERDADTAAAMVRRLADSLADTSTFAGLQVGINVQTRRAAAQWTTTNDVLQVQPRLLALDSLENTWLSLRADLTRKEVEVGSIARAREADVATVTRLRDSWTRTLELTRAADAPASMLDRVQATLTTIETVRPAIEQRRAEVLVLQDAVSRALQSCDDALARIHHARQGVLARIPLRQTPPLWRMDDRVPEGARAPTPFATALMSNAEALRDYARAHPAGLLGSGLIIAALMIVLARSGSAAGELAGSPLSAAFVLQTPLASAFLIGVAFSRPLRPYQPIPLQQLTIALGLVAALLVLRPMIQGRLMRSALAMAALLVLNIAREMAGMRPGVEQTLVTLELAAIAGVLGWMTALLGKHDAPGGLPPGFRRLARILMASVALGCGASMVAAASGFLELATFVGVNLFYLALAALVLLAFRVAATGVLGVALVRGPLARMRAIAGHGALIHRRLRAALDVMALWIWGSVALARFGLTDSAATAAAAILDAHLQFGDLDLPVGHVIAFVGVLAGAYLATRAIVFLLEEDVYSRMELPRGVPYALSNLTRYALLIVGSFLALATLGFDLTRITVLVSAFGVGVGFGLQQIINNFVSGLILLFERPVQVGDSIQLGDLGGTVLRIGIRSSTLRTSQGAEVIVPNSKLIEERVTNWTLSDRSRRVDLDVTVATDLEPERVIASLVEIAGRDDRVKAAPAPEAVLTRFGNDNADFQLRVWTEDPGWIRLRSDLGVAFQRVLRDLRSGNDLHR